VAPLPLYAIIIALQFCFVNYSFIVFIDNIFNIGTAGFEVLINDDSLWQASAVKCSR
jgi:hypothetical protein